MSNYKYVNTRMGTENDMRFSNGNVLPITAVPYGMASFTLQTKKNGAWFYSPYSKSFEGIILTHQQSPWLKDYGELIICGQNGSLETEEDKRWSYFDNRKCILEPALMRAYINRDRYTFALAPTNSGAVISFEFLQESGNRINFIWHKRTDFDIDKASGLLIGATVIRSISSTRGDIDTKEYFAASVDVPFQLERKENAISLKLEGKSAVIRLATSFISAEQAILNLKRELNGKSIEDVYGEAREEWEKHLSSIEIEDDDEEKKKTFYSCLYRFFLWPRRFYEINETGEAVHTNTHTGDVTAGVYYVGNEFWDTFRTVYPLLSLLNTEKYAEIAEGYYNCYKDCGWLPKLLGPHNVSCMPGMLVEATLSDAIVKNIVDGELAEKIFEAMLKDGECVADTKIFGRRALAEYRKYGYIPYTAAKESVNETLDSCYGDYCIAQAARKLGKMEIAERYYRYAKNYENLFDPEVGFMRAKDETGAFREEAFDSFAWGRDYTEGSAWQNSFAVYHDIKGLDKLYGGGLERKIDELVSAPAYYSVAGYEREIHEMSEMAAADIGQCAISNQPSFHIPYIYSELGNIEKTAALVERLSQKFNATAEGYPGDEDNGSMSAWYVLSCLGFYQMCPSRPEFTMSLPLFDKITVRLANGKQLKIVKKELNPARMKNTVAYTDIMNGGSLKDIVEA
ncbi:MAG: GH92 family glycosyl hydrolase [Clostridia bacterium]|nr:GH92 family glycosyl hydrolase [Clostridia bacterium]